MLVTPLLAALLLGADLATPAQGSVPGPWALAELSASREILLPPLSFLVRPVTMGAALSAVGGVGVELGGVRLSPTARFSIGPTFSLRGSGALAWSSLGLALAPPDLVDDRQHTGLRLTPAFGVSVPTAPSAFSGQAPLTTLFVAGQLERRLGVVELSWRPEARRSFLALEIDAAFTPPSDSPWVESRNSVGFGLSAWFQADPLLARNWLEH